MVKSTVRTLGYTDVDSITYRKGVEPVSEPERLNGIVGSYVVVWTGVRHNPRTGMAEHVERTLRAQKLRSGDWRVVSDYPADFQRWLLFDAHGRPRVDDTDWTGRYSAPNGMELMVHRRDDGGHAGYIRWRDGMRVQRRADGGYEIPFLGRFQGRDDVTAEMHRWPVAVVKSLDDEHPASWDGLLLHATKDGFRLTAEGIIDQEFRKQLQ